MVLGLELEDISGFCMKSFSNRWPLWALLALLLVAAWAEPLLVHRAYPRQIDIGGHDLGLAQGWSAKEIGEALPSAYGPVGATYRWSAASSELVFAPSARGQPGSVLPQSAHAWLLEFHAVCRTG